MLTEDTQIENNTMAESGEQQDVCQTKAEKLDENSSDDLQQQLAQCKKKSQEWHQKFLRASADFQNYQRRVKEDQKRWVRTGQGVIFTELLTILDDFDRAIESAQQQKDQQELSAWIEGFLLIRSSFDKMLTQFEVAEITQNKTFDPKLHEAIVSVESDDHESGEVVSVIQKGYTFKDSVLRHARVSVAK